ncbi:MAG: hypothetical protein RL308_2602 [Bacteroidota bacterium]
MLKKITFLYKRLYLHTKFSKMHRIIYLSSSVKFLTPKEINFLLLQSRKNNQETLITGILLYIDGDFLQVLEGPKEALLNLFETIKADHRHKCIITVFDGQIKSKYFPEWIMGFAVSDYKKISEIEGLEYMNREALSVITDKNALLFIESFINSHREKIIFV